MTLEIKLAFVKGLFEVVLKEISEYPEIRVTEKGVDFLYLEFFTDFELIKNLKSVSRAYLVVRDPEYNPFYISNHKSILGDLLKTVFAKNDKKAFKTFKIICAGSETKEIVEINKYIENNFGLILAEEADAKIQIIKIERRWEVGLQISPRPLSVREYRVKNMSGAMDSTIAFVVNYLCELERGKSYLNIFSGSGTLLIEVGQSDFTLAKIIGFDNNKEHLSLSVQNIKQAGLIKKIQIKEFDIFSQPKLGQFDIITSDLPFGMVIGKASDLENLYQVFIEYCEETLKATGKLGLYTNEFELLKAIINKSKFKIVKTLELQIVTAVNSYLKPKIVICEFRDKKC